MRAFLREHDLKSLYSSLKAEGVTSIDELRELDADDLRDMGVDVDAVFVKLSAALDATANE
jgi:hypothetical protein